MALYGGSRVVVQDLMERQGFRTSQVLSVQKNKSCTLSIRTVITMVWKVFCADKIHVCD